MKLDNERTEIDSETTSTRVFCEGQEEEPRLDRNLQGGKEGGNIAQPTAELGKGRAYLTDLYEAKGYKKKIFLNTGELVSARRARERG